MAKDGTTPKEPNIAKAGITAVYTNVPKHCRQLPNELIFELVLCVPSTDWNARRLLFSCSLVCRLISSNKKMTLNWRIPVPILNFDRTLFRKPVTSFQRMWGLLPRIHSKSTQYIEEMTNNYDKYMRKITKENEDGQFTTFVVLVTIDEQILPAGRSAHQAKQSLKAKLENTPNCLGCYCTFIYFDSTAGVRTDKIRLFFPERLEEDFVKQHLFYVLGNLDLEIYAATKGM